jgi:hypothetical protein
MPAPPRSDQVYQLSLIELAFLILFLILLLSGWVIAETGQERDAALARLAEVSEGPAAAERLEAARAALERAREAWRGELAERGSGNPEAIVSELVRKAETEARNQQLRQRIADLDAQLSTLVEIRDWIDAVADRSEGGAAEARPDGGAGPGNGADRAGAGRAALRSEIAAAMAFKRAFEQAAGTAITRADAETRAGEYAKAWREAADGSGREGRPLDLERENRDLRGRMAWLEQQLKARGGRDYPPCWAEPETGRPQYLFTIEIRSGGLKLAPAWPPERASDAGRLPGIDGLAVADTLPIPAFRARVQPLAADSAARHCRHYVRLVNRVSDLTLFNRYRYAVEEFFYKYELR